MTALAPSVSIGAPELGQPSEWPEPGDSECTTAKPRGTHVFSWLVLITGLVFPAAKNGARGRVAGGTPISWSTAQLVMSAPPA